MRSFILIFTPQLGIGLHQGLFAYRVLNFHLELSRNIYARLYNNLSDQATEWKTGIILILSLQHNIKNMLTQVERQSQIDGIQELSPLQN